MARLHQIYLLYEMVLVITTTASTSADVRKLRRTSVERPLLPLLQITPGPNTCETLKRLFGLTYEQMQGKRVKFKENLKIDNITKHKITKYNLNETKRLAEVVSRSENIVILVHGYWESSEGVMVQGLAPEYLQRDGVRVLAVDARSGISFDYFRATTYARFLGEEIGLFLSEIIKGGESASKVTIVGHSLGAHVANVAGKVVKQNTGQLIGRVSGLDPAGPCFANIHLDARLDPTDAAFVDVIHTNGGLLGLKEPVGHVDFYPNNGVSQPGCVLTTCDHSRAWELFAEALKYPHSLPGRKCENWTQFKNGACAMNEVAFIGGAPTAWTPGSYYMTTASATPYGMGEAGC